MHAAVLTDGKSRMTCMFNAVATQVKLCVIAAIEVTAHNMPCIPANPVCILALALLSRQVSSLLQSN